MRTLLFIAFNLFAVYCCSAQDLYLGVGGNITAMNLPALNTIIDRYNSSNNILSQDLSNIRLAGGPTISAGVFLKKLQLEISWLQMMRTGKAEGTMSGKEFDRQLKFNYHSLNAEGGYNFLGNENTVRFSLMGGVGIGNMKLLAGSKENLSKVSSDWLFSVRLSANLHIKPPKSPVGVLIKPYYSLSLNAPDLAPLDNAINLYPTTGVDYKSNLHSFGVVIAVTGFIRVTKKTYVDGDADEDGIKDSKDKCPDTPLKNSKGGKTSVGSTGCPNDSDEDGVIDAEDKCPGTPAKTPNGGVMLVDKTGCPKDTDGDGVPDYKDVCPNTPKNIVVDPEGCPPPTE